MLQEEAHLMKSDNKKFAKDLHSLNAIPAQRLNHDDAT